MSRNREQMQEATASVDHKKKHKLVDRNEQKAGSDDEAEGGQRRARNDSDIDDIDFEEVFEDDEEGGGEHEIEDEDQKDGKVRELVSEKGSMLISYAGAYQT